MREMKTKKDVRNKIHGETINTEKGKEFLSKYEEATGKEYAKRLRYYTSFRGMNCKELIEEAREDWNKGKRERDFVPEHNVNKFKKKMKEIGYSSNTVANILATIRAFFKFHQYPLNEDRLKREKRVNENHYKRIGKDDVRKLYNSTTSKRNKAILLFLYQTGQAAKQVADLKYGDVSKELEENKEPLMIEYSGRKGRGNNYVTFLGSDGIEALRHYLEERDSLEPEDPLFASSKGEERPITSSTVSEVLKYMAKKFGLTDEGEIKKNRNPYRPHAFRKNFKSQLATKCSNFVIEYMMGHELGVEKDYFLADFDGKEGLRKYYAQNMEPILSIQTTSTEKEAIIDEDVELAKEDKMKEIAGEEIEEETEKWRKKWTEERMERKALEEEVQELREKVEKIDQLGKLLESAGQLEGLEKIIKDRVEKSLEKKEN